MNKVKVLIDGYAKVNNDGTWDATCSTTFIDTGKLKIIVDPGCNRKLLLAALKKEGLKTGVIDYVFISHYHPDHCLLIGIFEKATVYDSVQYQRGPIGGETPEFLPQTDIQVVKTPGHAPEHASLLVPTAKGKILVGADVFWWADGVKPTLDLDIPDEFASEYESIKRKSEESLSDF